MKQAIAWIVPATPYEARALLGKACRAHVERAVAEAGLSLITDETELKAAQGPVLCVREDAACLSSETLVALTKAALEGQTAVVRGSDQEALAAALPKEALGSLLGGQESTEAIMKAMAQDLLEQAVEQAEAQQTLLPYLPQNPAECFTVHDAATYATAFGLLGERIAKGHMEKGVILLDPGRTVIEAEVQIGPGTMIYPGNTLQGKTAIGANCTLYPGSRLQNAVIGEETTVEGSVLLDCSVGSHTTVGPFAYLRPHTKVGDHCRIGDFVEVKNSSIGDETKISHLTYVGDSDLGKDINLGCGVVFVNYDGKTKSRSRVEDHAFIGCNCNLVAPVHIGKNAYLAAGSTVVEDVPEDALYVARARGVIKEGWVKRRKEEGRL